MAFELTDQVRRRIQDDLVMWLTTVSPRGRPSPRPVWFTWDGNTFTVYSEPTAAKVRHLSGNDRVAVSFNSTADGGDVVVLHGRGRVVAGGGAASANAAYLDKYRAGIEHLGMSVEQFESTYSTLLHITPESSWAIGD